MLGVFINIAWFTTWFLVSLMTIMYLSKKQKIVPVTAMTLLAIFRIPLLYMYTGQGGDYGRYIRIIERGNINIFKDFGISTDSIVWFNGWMQYFPIEGAMAFSMPSFYLGFLAVIFFCITIGKLSPNIIKGIKLYIILFLLFGINFWTVAIGKDSLVFSFIVFFIYFDVIKKSKIKYFFILLITIIRPHIGFVILFSFGLSFLLSLKVKMYKRIAIILTSVVGLIVALPYINKFLTTELTDLDALSSKIEDYARYSEGAGTYVDLSNASIPFKMFTYLFRPLPIEGFSMSLLPFVIENIFLMIFLFPIFWPKTFFRFFKNQKAMFFLLVGLLIPAALSNGLANYGLFFRQKWMAIPFLFIALQVINNEYNKMGIKV